MIARRIVGILFIAAGIAFCFGLLLYQYLHCVDMLSTYTSKAQEYASVMDYFFAVSEGAIIISVFGGAVLVTSGVILCKNQR